MRLFVAVDLGDEIHRNAAKLIESLRPRAPNAKWVNPSQLHVTLAFLGHLPDEQVEPIRDALARAVKPHRPLTVTAERGGAFGSSKHPRVLWVDLTGEVEALGRVQADVERELVPLGYVPEKREFRPHLTLARARDPKGDWNLAGCVEDLAAAHLGSARVEAVTLFKSELSPKGARYTPLHALRLDT